MSRTFDFYSTFNLLIFLISLTRGDYPPSSQGDNDFYAKTQHKPLNPGDPFYTSFNSIANFNHDPNKLGNRENSLHSSWHNLSPQIFNYNGLPSLYAPGKCVTIPRKMSLCKDVGYKKMLLPNFLDHYTLEEAVHQSSSWVGVRAASCHKDIQPFLCSLYAPLCIDGQGLRPCRSMCESVKEACEPILRRLNYTWPEMFKCDQFPEDDQLCLRTQVDKLCQACKPSTSFEQALDLFCQADFALKVKVEESVATEKHLRVTVNQKIKILKFIKRNKWTHRMQLLNQTFYVKGGYNCDCPQLETIDGVRDNNSLVFFGRFDSGDAYSQINDASKMSLESEKDNSIKNEQTDKLYASSVVMLNKSVRKMFQKASEVGKNGIDDMCKNRPIPSSETKENIEKKKPSKDKKNNKVLRNRVKPNKFKKTDERSRSRMTSKSDEIRNNNRQNDKKRRRGGVILK